MRLRFRFNLKRALKIAQIVGRVLEQNGVDIKGVKPSQLEAAVEEALTTQKKIKSILKPQPKST